MANLLNWLGRDVVAPIRRDVLNPIGNVANQAYHGAQDLASQGENTVAAAGAGIGGLARVAAGAVTHNPVAEQNALNQTNQAINNRLALNRAFLTAGQAQQGGTALIRPTLSAAGRIAPYAVGGLGGGILKPALAFGGANAIGTGLQGDLKPKDLAKSFALGAAPVGVGKAIGVGVRGVPAVANTIQKFDQAQNQAGAVGKNVGKPDVPLTRQEVVAGKALGMSQNQIQTAKNTVGLQKAFGSLASSTAPEDMAALKPNQQMAVSNVLKHMGEQKLAVPSTKSVGGELPPVKPVSAFTEFLTPKKNIPAKMGGSGLKISQAINNIEADTPALRAKWMSQIPTFQSLSKGDAAKAWDIKEGASPAGASANVLQAVKELRAQTPQIAKTAHDQGLLVGDRGPNYMPHSYDWHQMSKGSKYDGALQHLMDTQQVDYKTATQLFKNMAEENAGHANRFGNIENARLTDLPGYSKTKQAYYDYLQGTAKRVAETKHFGIDNQIVQKHLDNLRIEGGDTNIAAKTVENYLRSQDKGRGATALRAIRGLYAAGSLSKAAISHAGQLSNTAVEAGIGRTIKNTAIRAAGGGKQLIRESGVTNPQELHGYTKQYTGAGNIFGKATDKVTAPGLNPMMKFNRGSAAVSGPDFANSLLKKGNVTKVRSLGVTGKLGPKLTPDQAVQAARGLTKDTMFGASRAETPLYAETKTGKLVGQFRTAYAYRQSRFIKDQVINEAKKGNYAPLGRYLTVSAGIGAGTVAIKNKISGNKEGPGGKAIDTAAALGGIPGEVLAQFLRYGPRDVVKAVASTIAPLAGEAVTTAENVQKALGKNHPLAPLERQALGHIPLVGGRVSKAVLPSKTAAATAQNKTAQSNIQTEAQFRATKPQGQTLQQVTNSKGEKTYAYSLSDGSIATSKDKKTAQLAIQKDTFTQSGQNFQQLGKNIWQLDSNGNPTHTTVPVYQYSVNSATLTSQKDAGDIQGWLSTANNQLQNIQGQLKDPSTSPLKALQLQNDASTLQSDIKKYTGYGGFTKPKSGKSTIAARRSASSKAISSFKVSAAKAPPKPKGVSVRKLAAPSFKAPKTTKLAVSRIPVVTSRRKA